MGRMLIGLTGTFGSGKSTVAALLAERGAAIVDADTLAHEAVEPGQPALAEIKERFGEEFLLPDGRLDRKRMAEAVFSSPDKRKLLESIIHPHVRDGMQKRVRELEESCRQTGAPRVVVLDIPLLFECYLASLVEKTLVVTIDTAQRFHRVRLRNGLHEGQIVKRLASQWPQREKAARADYIVDNSGSLEETRSQVDKLYDQWLGTNPDTHSS